MDSPNSPPQENDRGESARERRMGNIILLGIFIAVVGAAIWLVNSMLEQRAIDDCAAQGRRNCAPIAGAGDRP